MLIKHAKTIYKLIHHTYSPSYNNTFGNDTYYVHFYKKRSSRQFQIKSSDGKWFDIIEVGLGNSGIEWKTLFTRITIDEITDSIKKI